MFWTVCIFYVNTQQTLLNIASFFKFTLFFNDSSMTSLSMRQTDGMDDTHRQLQPIMLNTAASVGVTGSSYINSGYAAENSIGA